MQLTRSTVLSELVHLNPSVLLMFEHFEIALPLHDKTVADICNEKGISTDVFITFANLFSGAVFSPLTKYELNDIQIILNYLKNSHTYYIDEIYPKISSLISEMNFINDPSDNLMVNRFFSEYFAEVKEHISYETQVVFPYISNLVSALANQSPPQASISYSVVDYKEHHNDIEEKLNDLKNLLIKYLPHKNDIEIRRKLLFSLFELEHDLNIHSLIEDTILIPLVEEMERKALNTI